jgi:nucleoside-diphosphate-sugar epimerase
MLRRTSRLNYIDGLEYERVEGDLRDPESLLGAVKGADAVVHVAGLTSALKEAEYQEVNALGTARLAAAARQAGVKRFVYVSSIAALGPSEDGKMPKTPRPITPYGRSKLEGEYPVLAERDAMSVAILRPPVVYGERDRALVPFYKIAKLGVLPVYGDGTRLLSWIHAHDLADAIIATALADGPSGAIYPVCDGETYTWRRLVETYARVTDKKIRIISTPPQLYTLAGYGAGLAQFILRRPLPLDPDEVRHMRPRAWLCNNDAITSDLGWQPKVDIETGFHQAYRWYREQGWL